jgi:two-component system, OmpR family, KDP operon response regulator KdpE
MAASNVKSMVLVIEDDAAMRRFIRASLSAAGYHVAEAGTGREGLKAAPLQPPDVVLLDLGLPDMDGLEVIRELRGWSQVPIVVVSARGREKDKVAALDAGADDYLTKPFSVAELLARLRVAIRHAARLATGGVEEAAQFTVGGLVVDLAARRVTVAEKEIHLTPLEYRLLTVLVHHAGKVLTHRFLLEEVWGPPYVEEMHYLRVYMAALRRKIESDPARPRYLLTEQGVGYRLVDE